jgi:glycine hydroxymethyltransferase
MTNKLFQLTAKEYDRQRDTLNLIASENYPSPRVLELLGSVWMNKYAEGAPGKRYYAGAGVADDMERLVQEKALAVFDRTGEYEVNVQLLSGSPANSMVFLAMLEAGDTVMSLSLANGGHLSHLHSTSNYLKFFNLVNYDVKETDIDTFDVDLADYRAKLREHRPKLVIIGFSAYPRAYEFADMVRWAHEAGALVLADIAHIAGLVAVGLHDSPFKAGVEGADFVTMTTHKTLRGPRGALLFAKREHMAAINRAVFPGTSGGPHLHQIAATGQALLEILGEDAYPDGVPFADYSRAVLDNTKALEKGLGQGGFDIVSPTQNHLVLVRLPDAVDSLEFQRRLEAVGIITNRNMIPFDPKSAWRPSGMRFGLAALTSRGVTAAQSHELGVKIAWLATGRIDDSGLTDFVNDLVSKLKWYFPQPPQQKREL